MLDCDWSSDVCSSDLVSVIAEIKRATPSKGILRRDFDPASLARAYAKGGARAISVLTDARFFQGGADDLRKAREASDLPILRKDFVIDEYQLWEARVMGADAALLIARILEGGQISEYSDMARELGLAALVEVHDERELERALDAGAGIVGVNNRDLDDFRPSIKTTERLRRLIPPAVVAVSESGISSLDDMGILKALKIDAALIGEELLKAPDPAARLRELRGGADA
jgi:indole-3-glycerol phosphate synthase